MIIEQETGKEQNMAQEEDETKKQTRMKQHTGSGQLGKEQEARYRKKKDTVQGMKYTCMTLLLTLR